jgi:octaprenyl-diphosphate synthase
MTALVQTKAFEYTRNIAEQEAQKARECIAFLSESPYKEALLALADMAVERNT